MKKVIVGGGFVVLAIILGVAIVNFTDARSDRLFHDQIGEYQRKCGPIIAWLEEEHEREGVYPQSLPSNFQTVLKAFAPPSGYRVEAEGTTFVIWIGDYSAKYRFACYYKSERGTWTVDT